MDIAASIQLVTEEIVKKIVTYAISLTGNRNLCLAGGVALNCVANGKLLTEDLVDDMWIQPAAGDAGGALGAALCGTYLFHEIDRLVNKQQDSMRGAMLGPEFSDLEIEKELTGCGANYQKLSDDELIDTIASSLSEGNAVGWMQGRMEFGPRALGCRSILADPRSPKVQKLLNLKVKFRESFRPFAPSVLAEHASVWFDLKKTSPYMLLVAQVQNRHLIAMSPEQEDLFGIDKLNVVRSTIPAVTHVDYSARIQTVDSSSNEKYRKLIEKFNEITGVPIIVNTSFNVRGEPIVCTPKDAYKCFMGTDIELLAVGNFILKKSEQDSLQGQRYELDYDLD
jgi:carbamoyltransferase